jgi:hypothetical protein
LIAGFVVSGVNAAIVEPVPKEFDKGLIFVKDTDILLSGDKWTIAVNIAVNDYEELIGLMKLIIKQIQQKIEWSPSITLYWEEVGRLHRMIQGLENDVRSFQKLLLEGTGGKRTKRGLLNVVGYGLKYLFGTADVGDVERLTKVCDELHTFEEKMTHASEQQLTYIRALDEVTKQNAKDIVEVTRTLRDSIRNVSIQLVKTEEGVTHLRETFEKHVQFSAAVREIEMAILDVKFSVIQLQEALDVTSKGQLSSVLINPYNLSVILQQVSLQLPAGLSMLTGVTVEDMYVYYAIAAVHAVASPKAIRLFIEIPLKAVDRYFELYQVHSLPFLKQDIGKFVMIDEVFTYIAVAESRQFFALMTPEMLSRCTKGLYTVCPSDIVLRTAGESNCLIALFLGKAYIMFSKCKRLILHEMFEPIWIRSPDSSYWIYSLSMPERITMQCREAGSPSKVKQSYSVKIQGTGILPNSSSCYIHAEGFKLLPHSLGKTTVFLERTQIVMPNVENLLNSQEKTSLLQLKDSRLIDLSKLDTVIERAASRSQTRGIDVERLTERMQGKDERHITDVWLWVTCTLVIILSVVILVLIRFKLIKLKCIKQRNGDQQCKYEPGQEADIEVKLEAGTTAASEPENQQVLTGYALPGLVIEARP